MLTLDERAKLPLIFKSMTNEQLEMLLKCLTFEVLDMLASAYPLSFGAFQQLKDIKVRKGL